MLNLKKCLFCVPFGNLLGYVVFRQELMVDPAKIVVILKLEALRSVKQVLVTLGHMGYHRKFIKGYGPDHRAYGETAEEGCHLMLER